jgi:hypothetical protein
VSLAEIEIARLQWQTANDRLEAERGDRPRYDLLHRQVDAVTAELRRRIGDVFTLAELVDEYRRAERWSRDAAASVTTRMADLDDVALVEDTAFHRYARGASDYEP